MHGADGILVVFDPVGNGATAYRTETASKIANDVKLSILRGNCGEIGIFANVGGDVKGVDSCGDLKVAISDLAIFMALSKS